MKVRKLSVRESGCHCTGNRLPFVLAPVDRMISESTACDKFP